MSVDAGTKEIWNIVRSHDPDRYLSALFAPETVRGDLMVLYAFHSEIARIPKIVSEPMLGEIRLQWWRDAIADPDVVTGSPLADALSRLSRRRRLPRGLLTGMLDARSFDLGDSPMPDLHALCTYFGKTEGTVFTLAAQSLKSLNGAPAGADRAGRQAGIALGLARLLRDPDHAMRFLPRDMTQEAGASAAGLEALHRYAAEALESARLAVGALPKAVLPAFLPLAMVEPELRAARNSTGKQIARINPLLRHWRLWRAVLRGSV